MNTLIPLLDLLVKSAAVFALAALACLVWRGASAAQRHAIWFAAFFVLLVLPFTKLAPPLWSFGIPSPSRPVSAEHTAPAPAMAAPALPAALDGHSPSGAARADWKTWAIAIWLAGVFALLARRVAGGLELRRLAKESRPVKSERMLRATRRIAGAERAELRESSAARVPMTWGIRRPVILLPSEAASWSDEQLAAALTHEAGHILRSDYALRLFAQIGCALYWVNPFLWLAAREMRIAQELACDDLVLRSGIGAEDYASQLVQAVKNLQSMRAPASQSLAMAHPSTLETRVRSIVDPARDRSPLTRRAAAAGVAICASLLLCASLARIGEADPEKNAPAKADAATESKDAKQTTGQLALDIQKILPARWKATRYDSLLVIERAEPVPWDPDVPTGPPVMNASGEIAKPNASPPKSVPNTIHIEFRIEPYALTDAQYARFKTENSDIQKRIDAQYQALEKMHMDQKFDDFIPKTDEQKKQVDAYKQLKTSLHVLPDYRYRDISLVYYSPGYSTDFSGVMDEKIRQECVQVFKDIMSLLAKYPGTD